MTRPFTHVNQIWTGKAASETLTWGFNVTDSRGTFEPDLYGMMKIALQMTGFSGTFDLQVSVDAGVTYNNIPYFQSDSAVVGSRSVAQISYTTETGYDEYTIPGGPWPIFRIVMTRSAGSVTGTLIGYQHDMPVSSSGAAAAAVTNAGLTELETAIRAEDTAHVTADLGIAALAIRDDTLDARSDTEGDYEPLHLNANGALWAALVAGTANIGDVDVLSSVGTDFEHFGNNDVDASAEQLTAFACKFGVTIKADDDNSDSVYVGKSDVTTGATDATAGFRLKAGQSIFLPVSNANLVYVLGGAANQKVYVIAV